MAGWTLEGVAAVVLKRLGDATADGDCIETWNLEVSTTMVGPMESLCHPLTR